MTKSDAKQTIIGFFLHCWMRGEVQLMTDRYGGIAKAVECLAGKDVANRIVPLSRPAEWAKKWRKSDFRTLNIPVRKKDLKSGQADNAWQNPIAKALTHTFHGQASVFRGWGCILTGRNAGHFVVLGKSARKMYRDFEAGRPTKRARITVYFER